jgi:glycosyltransferase involved in cell wall biosynthesis
VPQDDHLGLKVVVPTRDRPELLAECLDALLAAGLSASDVVVVDSASLDPGAVAPARERSIEVLRCEAPGASRARNLGWRATDAAVVAFVDDDVRVSAGWPAGVVAPFADRDVVLVTGAVGADGAARDRAVATTDGVKVGPFTLDEPGNVGASANLAIRRAVLEAVGGFDELLGAGGRFRAAEDLDLFDRALQLGMGWHAIDAHAVHDQWRDRRALLRLELAYGVGFGARLAKLLRTDRRRARRLLSFEQRRFGADLAGDVRRRYKFGLLSRMAWACGIVAGLARGSLVPVRAGHFRPRRSVG